MDNLTVPSDIVTDKDIYDTIRSFQSALIITDQGNHIQTNIYNHARQMEKEGKVKISTDNFGRMLVRINRR